MTNKKKGTEIQSFLFCRKKWTISKAKKWLKDHDYKVPEVDPTKNYYRFRQGPPFHYKKGTFRTIELGASENGIQAVIAVPRRKAKEKPSKKNPGSKKSRIPALLADLADARSVELEGGETIRFPLSKRFAMCGNSKGDEIWILSRKGSKKVSASDTSTEKLFEKFTGYEADDFGSLVQFSPVSLKRIGRAMSIVYRSDKFSKTPHDYIHAFKNYPTVSVDNTKRPKIVVLRGGKISITAEGIKG